MLRNRSGTSNSTASLEFQVRQNSTVWLFEPMLKVIVGDSCLLVRTLIHHPDFVTSAARNGRSTMTLVMMSTRR